MIDLKKANEEFDKYVKNYNSEDKKIALKIEHIKRVSEISGIISENLNLDKENIELAKLIGLLHDIGRFEQIRIYHTFIDKKSINHGELGAKVLFEEGLIRKFIETDEFDEIIRLSIINHNRDDIEEDLTERQLLHAKLIRDADRTDIFYILITGEEKTIWETDNMNNEIVTNEIYREFIEDKHIEYKNMETRGDILVGHFAYIYGLYFKPALKIFKDKKYVDQLYNRFSFTNKDTAEKFKVIYEKAKQYIEEKG